MQLVTRNGLVTHIVAIDGIGKSSHENIVPMLVEPGEYRISFINGLSMQSISISSTSLLA